MAKGLRSKRGKAMRRIKRVRYAAKELDKLKKTVATLGVDSFLDAVPGTANPISVRYNVLTTTALGDPDDSEMKPAPKYDEKTMRDEHGRYPVWYNVRKMRKQKVKELRKRANDVKLTHQQKRNLKKKIAKSKKKKGCEW